MLAHSPRPYRLYPRSAPAPAPAPRPGPTGPPGRTSSAAASVLPPVLLYALFRPGFKARGVRWAVYGTLPLIVVLMVFSPAFSGIHIALFPSRDFHWFPLRTPGLVTIPAGFLLGYLGSRAGQRKRPAPAHRATFIAQ